MGDDLEDAIRTNAERPASASDETGGVQQHTLADQIAADRHLEGKAAFKNRRSLGIRTTKLVPHAAQRLLHDLARRRPVTRVWPIWSHEDPESILEYWSDSGAYQYWPR